MLDAHKTGKTQIKVLLSLLELAGGDQVIEVSNQFKRNFVTKYGDTNFDYKSALAQIEIQRNDKGGYFWEVRDMNTSN